MSGIRKKRRGWGFLVVIVIVLALVGWYASSSAGIGGGATTAVEGAKVQRGPLRISVVERGNLDAAQSIDLVSEIEGRSTILWLIENGAAVAMRVTGLGRKVLELPGVGGAEESAKPLVVNPDFEVLLLPEGDITETAHTLDRFAARTGSQEVNRYLIHREGVERAVAMGLTVEEILEFLVANSRTPIPQNVEYSIRDWGQKLRFMTQEDVVLLEVDDPESLDVVLALEPVQRLRPRRISPTAAALRGKITEFKTIEELRGLGIFLK